MELLKKIDSFIAKVLKFLVIALMISLGLLLFLRVIIRYIPLGKVIPLFASMSWSDEVVEIIMAWMVLSTSTLIMRDKDHFRVTLLEDRLKGKASQNILDMGIAILGMIFFAALFFYSWKLVQGANWTTQMLKLSQKIPYCSILVNSGLMLIYQVRDLVNSIIKIKKKDLSY